MSIGSELGQYILQNTQFKKILKIQWEMVSLNLLTPLWVRQWFTVLS